MRRFQIEQSDHELYTPQAGLALVGLALNRYTDLRRSLRNIPKRHGIPNIELIRAYVGQLCLGVWSRMILSVRGAILCSWLEPCSSR